MEFIRNNSSSLGRLASECIKIISAPKCLLRPCLWEMMMMFLSEGLFGHFKAFLRERADPPQGWGVLWQAASPAWWENIQIPNLGWTSDCQKHECRGGSQPSVSDILPFYSRMEFLSCILHHWICIKSRITVMSLGI